MFAESIPEIAWPPARGRSGPPEAVWLIHLQPPPRWYDGERAAFLAQLYQEQGNPLRLTVCRTTKGRDGRWVDGITWDDLMAVKAAVGFGERQAIEIYPPDRDVVNTGNLRHLWLLEKPLPVGWNKRPPPGPHDYDAHPDPAA